MRRNATQIPNSDATSLPTRFLNFPLSLQRLRSLRQQNRIKMPTRRIPALLDPTDTTPHNPRPRVRLSPVELRHLDSSRAALAGTHEVTAPRNIPTPDASAIYGPSVQREELTHHQSAPRNSRPQPCEALSRHAVSGVVNIPCLAQPM